MASTSDWQLEDKRLLARVDDALDICQRRYTPHFIGFLDERQTMLVRSYMPKTRASYMLYGGHDEAERVMLGVFPEDDEPHISAFPLAAVGFRYGMAATLTHRDVLGSLLGLGIARDKIGDILCSDNMAVVFLHEDIASFAADSLQKIGRVGVRAQYPYDGELPVFHRFESLSGTIASPRLDAVLKILIGVAREKACDLIRDGFVQLDHKPTLSVSQTVDAGQIVSVRGHGRFVIDDISQVTKKGRLVLQARRYV